MSECCESCPFAGCPGCEFQPTCIVDECDKPQKARGWCAMHYSRWCRNGSTDNPRPALDERMERLIDLRDMGYASPCWVFTGSTSCGYGRMKIDGTRYLMHRFMWERSHGPIPDGLEIDHLCRVRACCNPDHLEPVTPQVNQLRGNGFSGINGRKTHCLRGHQLSGENVYLTSKNIRQCRTCRRIYQRAYKARKRAA